MRKKLSALLLAASIMCLGTTPALAGNTNYSTGKITNYQGIEMYTILENTKNVKATKNADWFLNVKKISFTQSTEGTLGMAFVPYKLLGGDYARVGASSIWAKKPFSSSKYASWNGNGKAKAIYYLGARLDTLLVKGSGTSSGYWNSN